MIPSQSDGLVHENNRVSSVRRHFLQVLDFLGRDRRNPAISVVVQRVGVGISCACCCTVQPVDPILIRIPDPDFLAVQGNLIVRRAQVVGQEQSLPLFMGTPPEPTFHRHILTQRFYRVIHRLQFIPLIRPDPRNLFLREISTQQRYNVHNELALIGVVQVIIIIIRVLVILRFDRDIPDISHGPDLPSGCIIEHMLQIFQHQFGGGVFQSLPQRLVQMFMIFFPRMDESERSPEHLPVVKRRRPVLEIPRWLNVPTIVQSHPRKPTTKPWIPTIKIFISLHLLLQNLNTL